MADPLSAVQHPVPDRLVSVQDDTEARRIRHLWSEIFHSPTPTDLRSSRSKALEGGIPVGERSTLRWIHWKLFLSDDLSSTPSSWTAVLDKDRTNYAHLRRTMLCAPDGNYPPDMGLEDDEEVQAQISQSRPSGSRIGSSRGGHTAQKGVMGDLSVNNPLSLDDSNPWKTHYASLETRKTIAQDVDRTFPDIALFQQARVRKGLTNALFVWCMQNEDVGYRQGMHELMAVLWLVRQRDAIQQVPRGSDVNAKVNGPLQGSYRAASEEDVMQIILGDRWIEHDVYVLFSVLMQAAKSWFEWRTPTAPAPAVPMPRTISRGTLASVQSPPAASTPTPIVVKCERIRELLHTADPSLAQRLDSLGIEPQLYALRWIRLIFTREFPLEDALKVWDGLLATDRSLALIDHICVAMLMRVRNELHAADYSAALQTLLRYPLDPNVAEGAHRTELLVQQAIHLRDNGATPTAGVAIVMQNRDLLGIPPRFPDAGSAIPDSIDLPKSSPTSQYAPAYQPRVLSKFATMGRVPSSSSSTAPWQRSTTPRSSPSVQQAPPRQTIHDPLASSSSSGSIAGRLPQSPSRPFGIIPSAYVPEGISDFARGLYERSDSLGINRALNSTMANVQRTVAAAAASVAASNANANNVGDGGFPSSFNESLSSSVTNASLSQGSNRLSSTVPAVPQRNASIPFTRSDNLQASANDTAVTSQAPTVQGLTAKLEALTSTNKAVGTALSACVEVLETSWLALRESHTTSSRDGLDRNDVDALMSFTALKHIRDVLNGTAKEFDPATLPSARSSAPHEPASISKLGTTTSTSVGNGPLHRANPIDAGGGGASTTTETISKAAAQSSKGRPEAASPLSNGPAAAVAPPADLPMSLPEYLRYGRQMILSDFGLEGQLRLRRSKVLVVGAGGLGCPAVQYLAAAGVGRISILDHDGVEPSNLARQILHTDAKVGMNKAESAARAARVINPFIEVVPHAVALSSANARGMIAGQDLVLDCTDNPLTRYLISDAAVLEGVQVVSGAAQGYDGQLIVLHKKIEPQFAGAAKAATTAASDQPRSVDGASEARLRGPCYRCLFPVAPRPEDVTDCEDGGVLGGITGLVGTMQALESVKILAGIGEDTPPTMVLVSPMSGTPFRSIRLRPRRTATCRSCGDADQVGRGQMITDLEQEDYVSFCGLNRANEAGDVAIPRTTAADLQADREQRLLVDIRPPVEFGITRIDGSINIPFADLCKNPKKALDEIRAHLASHRARPSHGGGVLRPLVVCRRGNDSYRAVRYLQRAMEEEAAANAALQRRSGRDAGAVAGEVVVSDPLSAAVESHEEKEEEGRSRAPTSPALAGRVELSDLVGGLRAYAEVCAGFPVY